MSDTVCPLDLDALDALDAANEPDDKTCPVVAAAVAAELERRDRRPCGPTHHLGCACHEARRDAEIEALRAELAQLRADREALRPLVVYATARIEQCRKDEAKFAAGSVAIDAATERRTWQTMLDMMGALADHVIEQRMGER